MNLAKSFLIAGAVYLLLGLFVGIIMGIIADHGMMPLHAHINLLGFTLMTVFGLCYLALPALGGVLGRLHFWLHQIGTAGMVIGLYLKYGPPANTDMGEMFLVPFSLLVVAGSAVWVINIISGFDRATKRV